MSNEFRNHLNNKGITRRLASVDKSSQNDKSERLNLTLFNSVRCMMIQFGVPERFWPYALDTAAYLLNRCSRSAIKYQIPIEIWEKKKLDKRDFKFMKVFGCQGWLAVKGSKLDPRSEECVVMGTSNEIKGYRLWNLKKQIFQTSADVHFVENIFPFKQRRQLESPKYTLPMVFVEGILGKSRAK